MSFLANYWAVVERQVSETGMNPGDIHVDISELLKNTQPANVVHSEPSADTTQPTNDRPLEDGDMSLRSKDLTACEERARRSVRSSSPSEGLETPEPEIRKGRTRRSGNDDARTERRVEGVQGQTKAQAKADRKLKRKLLKKLGTGRNVRVKLSEVNVNGTTVWDESKV